ncbi:hypothetical protein [Lysobacter gummosus]|uniref:Uncharacterized protein n=1 Tax=Lysobacter gummosus TaxID=262324 RepID=A0ABY3X834_9GAMM|nr:hypothetical protein [Lysobacter gummosus]ALN93250.1 phospholipase domain protein [Lysobacter gummosus]UNP28743.1 hypothetical protein MOV92_20020 [Lysobacter gummosus]
MFPTADELKARQDLLRRLHDSGNPAAIARADELQRTYHDDNMAVLSKDTYWSAMGEHATEEGKKSPPGWIRASENLDKLRETAPKLAHLTDKQLLDYLKPDDSGFRAEIYFPIPEVLAPATNRSSSPRDRPAKSSGRTANSTPPAPKTSSPTTFHSPSA